MKPDEVPSPTQGREPASELVLERLPARRERPIAIALAVGAVLALLIWAPWRPDAAALPQRSAIAAASVEPTSSSSAEAVTPTAPPSVAPGTFGTRRYVSITDNEWTVVALLTTAGGSSTEEPAMQHEASPAATDGPLAVLQQGVDVVAAPVERPDRPAAVCASSPGSRDRTAVHLPAGRVVYLGITFPGIYAGAQVDPLVLGRPGAQLTRAADVEIDLAGMPAGWHYSIPTTGPGGTILFASSPADVLPSAPYRFELISPQFDRPQFLYACVGL